MPRASATLVRGEPRTVLDASLQVIANAHPVASTIIEGFSIVVVERKRAVRALGKR
jgi:hypothetical protein